MRLVFRVQFNLICVLVSSSFRVRLPVPNVELSSTTEDYLIPTPTSFHVSKIDMIHPMHSKERWILIYAGQKEISRFLLPNYVLHT